VADALERREGVEDAQRIGKADALGAGCLRRFGNRRQQVRVTARGVFGADADAKAQVTRQAHMFADLRQQPLPIALQLRLQVLIGADALALGIRPIAGMPISSSGTPSASRRRAMSIFSSRLNATPRQECRFPEAGTEMSINGETIAHPPCSRRVVSLMTGGRRTSSISCRRRSSPPGRGSARAASPIVPCG
jgi:hypothetical protein